MKSPLALAGLLLLAACAAAPAPADTEFSRALIERADASTGRVAERVTVTVEPASHPSAADPFDRLFAVGPVRREELEVVARDPEALSDLLAIPLSRDDLAALAVFRSPAIRAARARVEAARTGYRQADDLADLVAIYRAFAKSTDTLVGPVFTRVPTGRIAPAPGVALYSAVIVHATIRLAVEDLRAAARDVVVEAERAHSDAARLRRARAIVAEDLDLSGSLLEVLRSRFESGNLGQAGYLSFEGRLESLRAERAALEDQEAAVRARMNRLLDRSIGAPIALGFEFAEPGPLPGPGDAAAIATSARRTRPEHRRAEIMAGRAATAVRLAETMTFPRMDVGSSRFERERTGEAGVERGPVFPEPGRMVMPASEFGVREAQVEEMRARQTALEEAVRGSGRSLEAEVVAAIAGIEAARHRLAASEEKIVPLAARSYEAARGAYEGGQAGYLDLLDAARNLLAARLTLADRRRALLDARAELIRVTGAIPGKEAIDGGR